MPSFDEKHAAMTPERRSQPVTLGQHLDYMNTILVAMKKLNAQLAALQDRIGIVEMKGITYRGTYQRSAEYKRGEMTTHRGSMWSAVKSTSDEPGKTASWQLAVKAGRDGKDAT